jgi:hypothetical protein
VYLQVTMDTSITLPIDKLKELFSKRGCEIIDMVSPTSTILYRCKCKALLRHKAIDFINYDCDGCRRLK